jgi:hypothetical protein
VHRMEEHHSNNVHGPRVQYAALLLELLCSERIATDVIGVQLVVALMCDSRSSIVFARQC